jgi:hypothetical protein
MHIVLMSISPLVLKKFALLKVENSNTGLIRHSSFLLYKSETTKYFYLA